MSTERLRAYIVIPGDLLREDDDLVGPRKRNEFFADAAREKIQREKLRRAAHELRGSLASADIPGWESSGAARNWVQTLRRQSG
jgi:metal-responsive CopG/Arc/MetJ family transcriptional regulator